MNLSEEEREVIDMKQVEAAMSNSITALKWEYTNTLVTRLTPGVSSSSQNLFVTTSIVDSHYPKHVYIHVYTKSHM